MVEAVPKDIPSASAQSVKYYDSNDFRLVLASGKSIPGSYFSFHESAPRPAEDMGVTYLAFLSDATTVARPGKITMLCSSLAEHRPSISSSVDDHEFLVICFPVAPRDLGTKPHIAYRNETPLLVPDRSVKPPPSAVSIPHPSLNMPPIDIPPPTIDLPLNLPLSGLP